MSSENLWILKDRYLIEKPICDREAFLCIGKGAEYQKLYRFDDVCAKSA